ncbi:MAG: DUF3795 domain-containing protein [Candidatus Odinarchaeota archaeon]
MEYTKKHAAICGLYCPACTIFIGTQEDPKRLEMLANQFDISVEEMKCYGCRSEKRIPYCDTCKLYPCAQKKGIDFCGMCEDYPCDNLKEFQAGAAHRFELWNAQDQIAKEGYEIWMENMKNYYSCSQCGTINSAYDAKCRSCGHKPSNQYIKIHGNKILEFFEKYQTGLKKE